MGYDPGGTEDALRHIREEIGRKAREPVTVIAATKTRSAEQINRLASYGVCDYGENRVQEWQGKRGAIDSSMRFHMIGRLQTNKAAAVAPYAALIHSLDRPSLALALDAVGRKLERPIPTLVEVSAAGEAQKGGVGWDDAEEWIARWQKLAGLSIRGLMLIAPLGAGQETVRLVFRRARLLYDRLAHGYADFAHLSMGMSGDYGIALEEGANMIRIGSALFGARATPGR